MFRSAGRPEEEARAGERIRAIDWHAAGVGERDAWPRRMAAVVDTLLMVPTPMASFWGRDGVAIFNDRYAALLGPEGLDLLGQPAAAHGKDLSELVAATFAGPLAEGTRASVASLRRPYVRFDASPIVDESGTVLGALVVAGPAAGGRGQTLLLGLADHFLAAATPRDITPFAIAALGREIDARRVVYAEVDLAHPAAVTAVEWNGGGFAGPARVTTLDALATGRIQDLARGTTVSAAEADTSVLVVPLVRDGRLRALLRVTAGAERVWLPEDIALVEQVAIRTSDALDRVQAAVVLRRNQARQSFLLLLGDRVRDTSDAADIVETTIESVGRQLHANRAGYGEVSPDGRTLDFASGWSDGTVEVLTGTFPFTSLGELHADELRRGLTTVVESSDPSEARALVRGLRTAILVPLIRDGRLRATLALGRADAHPWSTEEIALVGEAAARMWEALERTRAEAALLDLNATLESRVEQRTVALRSSEARFRTLFENAPAGIVVIRVGPKGPPVFEAVNAATENFMGRGAAEIVGRDVGAVASPGDPLLDRCLECARTGQPVQYEMMVEVGGEARTAECVLAPLAIDGGDGQMLIGIWRDISAQRRAEDQLRQAHKMEAIGQLTGGIAHDFNNLLTGILGSLALMQKRVAQGKPEAIGRYVDLATASANRAAALTHRLLAFSRRQPLEAKPVDVNRLVVSMDDLLRRTLGESVELATVETAGLWQTLCDPHQLENALLNLAINARDAMPGGGRLTIETANAVLDDSYVAHEPGVETGDYVALSVTDTGTGMPPEVMARAFDPFFTTKPLGQGTGLGLSMIYGFVKQSEGHIKIYSEPGRGTSIKIFLPRFLGVDDATILEVSGATPRALEGETVLVVEDDGTVRNLVLEVLQDLGYTAVQATDGHSGLAELAKERRVDLLITDVGLPGLSGRQLAEEARRMRPDLKVLFITGYAENAAFGGGHLDPGMQMMTKPFAVDALAKRIRAMIQGA